MAEKRNILNIHLYHPDGRLETSRRSIFAGAAPIDIPWVVNKEWGVEAGNMLVSGEPDDIQYLYATDELPQYVERLTLNSKLGCL